MLESFAMALLFLKLACVIALSILPGQFLAKRFEADPLTRLSLSVLGSCFFLYLLEFISYLLGISQLIPFLVVITLSAVSVLALYKRIETVSWNGVLAWTSLNVWMMLLQSFIVVYGATLWFGDWYEHYERSIFFVRQAPSNTRFLLGAWSLPARAPIFNSAGAFFHILLGQEFWTYQIIATVFNTAAVLPLALLFRDVAGLSEKFALLIAVVLFAIAPFAVQSETFTWTKFFALAYLLQAIHFYILGSQRNDSTLLSASMVLFAAGMLAHYLLFIFWIFFLAHYLYSTAKKSLPLRSVVSTGLICAIVLGSWFTYAIARFGINEVATSNSTFGNYAYWKSVGKSHVSWWENFIANCISTTVPYGLRHQFKGMTHAEKLSLHDPRFPDVARPPRRTQSSADEPPALLIQFLADLVNSPSSLTGALGISGILAIGIAIYFNRRRGENILPGAPSRMFWTIFLAAGIPLNILASHVYAPEGVASLNLYPYVCLIWVFVARCLKNHRKATAVVAAIFVIESLLGTAALLILEARPVPVVMNSSGKFQSIAPVHLNTIYVSNYLYKIQAGAVFLSDYLAGNAIGFQIAALILCFSLLGLMLRLEA